MRDHDSDTPLLYVVNSGEEACAARHCYGPAMRGYYLIHLVISGCGIFENAYGRFPIQAGQGFMIFPDDITIYTADMRTPWHYAWVGYAGAEAGDLTRALDVSPSRPVVNLGDWAQAAIETVRQISADTSRLKQRELAATGGLLRLLALIEQGRIDALPIASTHESYRRAMWFINANFQRPGLHIEDVAHFAGLSRSQLFRVFKAQCGQSPQQVLGEMRLNRACQLLKETSLSLKAVALSSGFTSAARMGEVFRERLTLTPKQYREKNSSDFQQHP